MQAQPADQARRIRVHQGAGHAAQGHRDDGSASACVAYQGEQYDVGQLRASPTTSRRSTTVQVDVGRGITYEEVRRHAPVAFIGNDVARPVLLRTSTRSARRIEVKGNPYEVVGVAKALGSVFGNRRTTS